MTKKLTVPELRMRYLGVLGLLEECSPMLLGSDGDDLRSRIDDAMMAATDAGDIAGRKYVGNRIVPILNGETR